MYGGVAMRKLGKPFSWLTRLLLEHRYTLLFCRTSPKWCGELAGKRLFPVCGLSPTYKASYIKKRLVFFAFALWVWGEKRKGDKSVPVHVHFALKRKMWDQNFSNTRSWGICCRSMSLFLWFTGVFWRWVSKQKKWCYNFGSRERVRLQFLRGASCHFSETLPEKV